MNYQYFPNVTKAQNLSTLLEVKNATNNPITQNVMNFPVLPNTQNIQYNSNKVNFQNNAPFQNIQKPIIIPNENMPNIIKQVDMNNVQNYAEFQPIIVGNLIPSNVDYKNITAYPNTHVYQKTTLPQHYAQQINSQIKNIDANKMIKNDRFRNQDPYKVDNFQVKQENINLVHNNDNATNKIIQPMIIGSIYLEDNNNVIPNRNIQEKQIKNTINYIMNNKIICSFFKFLSFLLFII